MVRRAGEVEAGVAAGCHDVGRCLICSVLRQSAGCRSVVAWRLGAKICIFCAAPLYGTLLLLHSCVFNGTVRYMVICVTAYVVSLLVSVNEH